MQRRTKSKEERQADAVGRVDTQALRAALEEVLRCVKLCCLYVSLSVLTLGRWLVRRAEQVGRAVPLGDVARRHGADETVLAETLQHCGLVPVEKAADGRLVAARKTFGGGGGSGGDKR